jgi:hypothetical protein
MITCQQIFSLLSLCIAPVSENSLGYAQHTIHISEKQRQTRSNQTGEADKQAAVAITEEHQTHSAFHKRPAYNVS